jgi:hypothetical protein
MVRANMIHDSARKGRPMLRPLFASLFAFLITMPGCGKNEPQGTAPVDLKESFARGAELAPDFQAVDLEGVPGKLSDFRGKVVALSFWAEW